MRINSAIAGSTGSSDNVEPASASSVAGLKKYIGKGYFKNKKGKLVCVLTGHGLKDPDRAIKVAKPPKVLDADVDAVLKEIGL